MGPWLCLHRPWSFQGAPKAQPGLWPASARVARIWCMGRSREPVSALPATSPHFPPSPPSLSSRPFRGSSPGVVCHPLTPWTAEELARCLCSELAPIVTIQATRMASPLQVMLIHSLPSQVHRAGVPYFRWGFYILKLLFFINSHLSVSGAGWMEAPCCCQGRVDHVFSVCSVYGSSCTHSTGNTPTATSVSAPARAR